MNQEHNCLKQYAHQLLLTMGFVESEIQEEYTLRPHHREYTKDSNPKVSRVLDAKNSIRIDVVGINHQHKVAIECGITNSENLAMEKLFFDEVIILPFFKMDTERVLLERRIDQLERELAESKAMYDAYRSEREKSAEVDALGFIRFLVNILESIADKQTNGIETYFRFNGPHSYELNNAYVELKRAIFQADQADKDAKD